MKTQIEQVADLLNEKEFKCSIWKNYRIYINSINSYPFAKDLKVFLEFDNPDNIEFLHMMDGVRLKVFTNAKNVHWNWIVKRVKPIKLNVMEMLYNIGLSVEPPCDDIKEVFM